MIIIIIMIIMLSWICYKFVKQWQRNAVEVIIYEPLTMTILLTANINKTKTWTTKRKQQRDISFQEKLGEIDIAKCVTFVTCISVIPFQMSSHFAVMRKKNKNLFSCRVHSSYLFFHSGCYLRLLSVRKLLANTVSSYERILLFRAVCTRL